MKSKQNTLLRTLGALSIAASLVGCALPVHVSDPGSDNWERELGAPLRSSQSAQPAQAAPAAAAQPR